MIDYNWQAVELTRHDEPLRGYKVAPIVPVAYVPPKTDIHLTAPTDIYRLLAGNGITEPVPVKIMGAKSFFEGWKPGLSFVAMFSQGLYRADAKAVCQQGHSHSSPDDECACGFYAYVSLDELWLHMCHFRNNHCLLEVDLSGYVLEGEKMYRAAHQRVLRVIAPPVCKGGWTNCEKMPVVAVCYSGLSEILFTCDEHSQSPEVLATWTAAEMAAELGTEVVFPVAPPMPRWNRKRLGRWQLALWCVWLFWCTIYVIVALAGTAPGYLLWVHLGACGFFAATQFTLCLWWERAKKKWKRR